MRNERHPNNIITGLLKAYRVIDAQGNPTLKLKPEFRKPVTAQTHYCQRCGVELRGRSRQCLTCRPCRHLRQAYQEPRALAASA